MPVLLLIFTTVDIYLISMGFTLQRMMRENDMQRRRYTAEAIIVVLYSIHFYCNLNNCILQPVVRYLIFNHKYKCGHIMKHLIWVSNDIGIIMYPLNFQLIFIGILWQLVSIQNRKVDS